MSEQRFFIGRPIYWALAAAVSAVLATLGILKIHVREFVPFQFTVLGLAVIVVAVIITTYKPGDQIIRESLDNPDED